MSLDSAIWRFIANRLQNHHPFEVPMQTPFNENTERGRFRKAACYTDHALGDYFRAAKNEPWYDNTLFILVADHGHRLPNIRNLDLPESKRIPLLFYGNVLIDSLRGTTIDKTDNQNDIAAIILNQLHKSADGFPRRKDVLNPSTKNFAYYTNSNVLGWITPLEKFTYTFADKSLRNASDTTSMAPLNDSIILDAKAYLQTHYRDYLKF
ncbi:MAG: sulfatase-like hydrolase/transferase [Saprospiraceae bacterium]